MGNRFGSNKNQQNAPVKPKEKEKTKVWSISSLRRRHSNRRMSWIPRPHMDSSSWLDALDLHQYRGNFLQFAGVEDFLYCDEPALTRLGVRHASHRTRMLTSLRSLREKYEKNHKLRGLDAKPRISLVEDSYNPDSNPFTPIIHTPLPPTPKKFDTPKSKASTPLPPLPTETSFYSPINNNSLKAYSSFRHHTSKSNDSILNTSHDSNASPQLDTSFRSNNSINNRTTSNHSSNPNILSPASSTQPQTNPYGSKSPIKFPALNGLQSTPSPPPVFYPSTFTTSSNSNSSTTLPTSPPPPTSPHNREFLPNSHHGEHINQCEEVVLRDKNALLRKNSHNRSGGVMNMPLDYDNTNSPSTPSIPPSDGDLSHTLEWELSLESSDLRSHAWYHGNIPRQRAEEIVSDEGSFLIRDCTTQAGSYVLTCVWDGKVLHFVIQKTVVQPDTVYERIQFELEDEAYDSIPDLICAYVGNKKMVTKATGARILTPMNRTKPLSFYETLYKREAIAANEFADCTTTATSMYDNRRNQAMYSPAAPSSGVGCSIVRSSAADIALTRGARPANRIGVVADEKSSSSDGIISCRATKEMTASTHSLPRQMHLLGGRRELSLPPIPPTTTDHSGEGGTLKPPPKPSRVPSFKVKAKKPAVHVTDRVYAEIEEEDLEEGTATSPVVASGPNESNPRFSRLSEVYHPSGSDSGNGSGDSIQTNASETRNRDSQGSLVISALEDDSLGDEAPLLSLPDLSPPSCYNLEGFNTFLLPQAENPPLDSTALNGINNTLMETGSRIIAAHLTYTDLEVLNGFPTQDFGLGVTSGIEMITLPQGQQLRKDLIERTECMRLLVATTVLKAEDISARAELIHKWIQIAIDTKTATGNLYSFNNIMLGLCNPQISRLTSTWHLVRQKFTDSAFSFESKLRSTLKAMNECSNPQAPNTIIPHILPFIMLCERDLEDIYSLRRKDESLLQWESSCSDYGLQMLLHHLQEGRNFCTNLPTYRRNAQLILEDPDSLEDLILDVFRTEFHLKFLFGSRGAHRDPQERYAKYHQIVCALSSHCESGAESAV